MDSRPPPLAPGTVLQGRFELESPLGRGSFGITYRARDVARGDLCVVRELAPADAERDESGVLRLSHAGEAAARRLRQVFTREAERLMRLTGKGLPLIRANFVERGTAFLVREHLPEAMTLAERILQEGRQSPEFVEALLLQLSETLAHVHANGMLHLDLRPTNILLAQSGAPYLIDFGDARRWRRELFKAEDSVEGLPPELTLRGSRTGPATDLFELGASLYAALTGMAPALGEEGEIAPVSRFRNDVPRWLDEAIGRALSADPGERPRSAREIALMREPKPEPDPMEILNGFVQKAIALKSLKFDRRQCPSCRGVLEEPRPLKLRVCPVCHEGTVRPRKVIDRLCPQCRMGVLKHLPNLEPPSVCPGCGVGLLAKQRRTLFSKEFLYTCPECAYEFDWQPPILVCVSGEKYIGDALTCEEWRRRSGRSAEIWLCPCCSAQFDRIEDGRWRLSVPERAGKYCVLEPDEWARVAAGLPPEAGNAECDACGADFYTEENHAALLETRFDPHGFAAANTGRFLTFEELRWVGVGKESPHPGLACTECGTEFDFEGDVLRLQRTPNSGMLQYAASAMSLDNWHRAAADLPLAGKEKDFDEAFDLALRETFTQGLLPFSHRDADLLWRGHAARMEEAEGGWRRIGDGQLSVDRGGIRFGGMFKKAVIPLNEVRELSSDGVRLDLVLVDGDVVSYDVQDVEWSPPLDCGPHPIRLTVYDLMARLRHELASEAPTASASA